MSDHTFTRPQYAFAANAGQDDEFEIIVDVKFKATPEQPDHWNKSIGTWEPGGGGELEVFDVIFSDADKARFQPHELAVIREAIEAEISADDSALWEYAADCANAEADYAADRRRDDQLEALAAGDYFEV